MGRTLILIVLFSVSFAKSAWPQLVTGVWEGFILQQGSLDTFYYQLDLLQQGDAISGTSMVADVDGATQIRFSVSGAIEAGTVVLQEIEQLTTDAPNWCKKFAELRFQEEQGSYRMEGNWKADGCTPGQMFLQAKQIKPQEPDLAQARLGKWVGYLTQSDRDHGFYFEMTLEEGGKGSSYIVSEGGGGWAMHTLVWAWDEALKAIDVQEQQVFERGEAGWPWCIKNTALQFTLTGDKMKLEGPWSGFIENTTSEKGRCAEGTILLERLLPKQEPLKLAPSSETPILKPEEKYHNLTGRPVEVQRIVDVRSNNIQLKMWDNGVVDGDILTLYLNGEVLVEQFRLSKRKSIIEIQLESAENVLILHADDLGDLPPNTVAVTIDDGEKEQLLMLTSNLKESGAVLIRRFKVQSD